MLDTYQKKIDNTNSMPIPNTEGKHFTIKKEDMRIVFESCKKHEWVLDPTEQSSHWQGYTCKKCGLGRLVVK